MVTSVMGVIMQKLSTLEKALSFFLPVLKILFFSLPSLLKKELLFYVAFETSDEES